MNASTPRKAAKCILRGWKQGYADPWGEDAARTVPKDEVRVGTLRFPDGREAQRRVVRFDHRGISRWVCLTTGGLFDRNGRSQSTEGMWIILRPVNDAR